MFRNFINFKVLHGIRTFSKLVDKKEEKTPTKKTLGSLEHSRSKILRNIIEPKEYLRNLKEP